MTPGSCVEGRISQRLFSPVENRPPRQGGFTLVEMLVAVAIVIVLAALALPSLRGVIQSGKRAKCLSNLRQIGAAALMYCGDNNGQFPSFGGATGNIPWNQTIAPYLGVSGSALIGPVFQCPVDARPYNAANAQSAPRSYQFNGILNPPNSFSATFGLIGPGVPSRLLSQVGLPAETIMICEDFTTPAGLTIGNRQASTIYSCVITGWVGASGVPLLPNGRYYHGNGANFVFVDGHADSFDPNNAYANMNSHHGVCLWSAVR